MLRFQQTTPSYLRPPGSNPVETVRWVEGGRRVGSSGEYRRHRPLLGLSWQHLVMEYSLREPQNVS